MELDTTRLVVGVDLKVIPIEEVHIFRFLEEKEVRPDSVSLKSNQEFQLGLERIKEHEKFIFKSASSFLTQNGKLNSTPEGLYIGIISISNIVFDDSRTKGVLTAGYACGNLCGYSFRIYIELQQGTWNISEMKMYSIS